MWPACLVFKAKFLVNQVYLLKVYRIYFNIYRRKIDCLVREGFYPVNILSFRVYAGVAKKH